MNVSRHVAKDMRSALTLVRDLHGPDAVILSNKKVPEGIEITAAVDYDETLLEPTNNEPQKYTFPSADGTVAKDNEAKNIDAIEKKAIDNIASQSNEPARLNSTPMFEFSPEMQQRQPQSAELDFQVELSNAASQRPAKTKPDQFEVEDINPTQNIAEEFSFELNTPEIETTSFEKSPEVLWTQDSLMNDMRKELSSLKSLVETQISGFAWGEMSRKAPVRAGVLRKLVALGLTPGVARHIAYRISENTEHRQAWYRALAMLARQVPIAGDTILSNGGIVALVGPAGVGKTTLIAKLAVQYAARHGRENVALITTDSHRFGAFDQLKNLGSILKIPVRTVSSHQELEAALDGFLEKQLVLIDSAGLSHRDKRLVGSLQALKASTPMLKAHMVLSATTQADALEQMINAFKPIEPVGCIITKVDESTSLGPVLSAIVEHKLPITYYSEGQKIPDDLKVSQIQDLVGKAVAISKSMNAFDRADDITMEQIMTGGMQ